MDSKMRNNSTVRQNAAQKQLDWFPVSFACENRLVPGLPVV